MDPVLLVGGSVMVSFMMLLLWMYTWLIPYLSCIAIGVYIFPFAPKIVDVMDTAKKLLSFIGELPEWYYYNRDLEDLKEELITSMNQLLSVKQDVDSVLSHLELQYNKRRTNEVQVWSDSVVNCKREVDNLVRDVGDRHRLFRFFFRVWLGKCMKEKKKEIEALRVQRDSCMIQPVIDAEQIGLEPLRPIELVGEVAAKRVEDIVGHLKSPDVTILGVQGDQGMGKTHIMNNVQCQIVDEVLSILALPNNQNPMFDCVYYVTIKKEKDANIFVYNLQAAIGKELKMPDLEEEDDVKKRASRIQKRLLSPAKFVLILDGLNSDFEPDTVGIPVNHGGKLVVVTHSTTVCRRMLCREVVKVDALPFEDAKSLFIRKLNPSRNPKLDYNFFHSLSKEIRDCAVEIIKRCNGVPTTIIQRSTELRNVDDIYTWNTVLSDLPPILNNV